MLFVKFLVQILYQRYYTKSMFILLGIWLGEWQFLGFHLRYYSLQFLVWVSKRVYQMSNLESIVILAIGTQIMASAINALGYVLQKQAHIRANANNQRPLRYLRWWVGFAWLCGSFPLNCRKNVQCNLIVSLLFADQSLLSTLAPFSIIFSLLMGRLMLKEEVTCRHYISSILMIIGSSLALIFSAKNTSTYNSKEIRSLVLSGESIITLTINFSLMAIFFILSHRIITDIKVLIRYFPEETTQQCLLKQELIENMTDSTCDSEVDSEEVRVQMWVKYRLEKLKKEWMVHNPKWLKLSIFTYPWFAGFMAGLTALTAKWGMMIITNMNDYENYSDPFAYFFAVIPWIFAISELAILNIGFKYFETTYIIPIFKASIVFHNTMCGGVLLQEFFIYKAIHLWMYSIGILIWIGGILIMLVPKEKQNKSVSLKIEDYQSEPLVHKSLIKTINDDEC